MTLTSKNMLTIGKIIRDRARITPVRLVIDEPAGRGRTRSSTRTPTSWRAGSSHGERVSTLTGNTGEHVAVMFACAKAGAILHPISWRLAAAEAAYQLDDADLSVFLIEDAYRELGEAALELADVLPALTLERRFDRAAGVEALRTVTRCS